MVDRFNPAIQFDLKDRSGPDCNRAVILCKAGKKFSIADFEQNIANRISYCDI